MLRCLFCDAELSDSLLRSGCCPNCGGRLMWPDAADQPSAASTDAPDPESPAPVPEPGTSARPPESAAAPVPPVVPPGRPQLPPVSGQRAPLTPPLPPGGPSKADLPPDVLARVTAAWSEAFDSQTFPRHTIKATSHDTAMAPSLVIRSRQLAGIDRAPVDEPDYELLDVIGEGGVGVVYSARQNSIDRMVAVKMLKPQADATESPHDKFLSEAVVTGELEHPNIVPIYDLGSTNDGTLFYSMKRVHGIPWDKAMPGKSLAENLEILMKVCDAIAFAHSRGVIHRDLKPENVMLGGFGEVLVMDWGIALASPVDGKGRNIRQSATMGGTPAYMAPEMVTGPLERVGVASDIYLLGALLYEIVTGLAPHTGDTVMDCLYAAAANEIQRTDKTGELVEIAVEAMATRPEARHQSVKEFQDALRAYQSHAESIVLSTRAAEDLEQAVEDRKYEHFARALFGFEEAASLWSGNVAAQRGVVAARRAYAEAALDKNDFELGLSLIDPDNREHAGVARLLEAGQAEQRMRSQRITMLKRVALGLVVAMLAGAGLALVEINDKRATAETRQREAETARAAAEDEKVKAEEARSVAVVEKQRADQAREDTEKERDRATLALLEEAKARAAAQTARKREQRETYVAQIGLAAERVDANAFDQAAALLDNYRRSPLANWEWGRLAYICRPHQSMHDAGDTVQLVHSLGDTGRFVVVTRAGRIGVWHNAANSGALPQLIAEFALPQAIAACAFDSAARRLAAALPDSAEIQLYDLQVAEDGVPAGLGDQPVRTLAGHAAAVTSLEFSPDSKLLLSGSLDHTARLWDVESAATVQLFQGHSWSVWQATFSPVAADRVIATAGQDGRVIVWSTADGSQVTDFNEHQGPVRAVAFSADGRLVATAGDDRRILVWDWRAAPPLDLQQLISQGTRPAVSYAELAGHRAAVSCLRFSPSNPRRLVSGSDDNSLLVWDVSAEPGSGRLLVPLRGHSRRVTTCAFAPGGLHLLSGSEDRKWGLWDVAGFQEVNQLQSTSLRGHENGILAARFSPDGRQVATASLDRTARLWDVAGGSEQKSLREGHDFLATTVIALRDGRRLLTSAGDNSTRLWDLATGSQTAVLTGTGRHAALAVSADGRRVLTGAVPAESPDPSGSTVQRTYALLWDLDTQQIVRRFGETIEQRLASAAPLSAVTAAAISADGALVFTGHSDGQGRLWRGDADQPVPFQGHTRSVTAAAFVPSDPNRLLTASGDRTVAQWDVDAGRERLDLAMDHDGWVTSLSVSDDGRTALTSSEDGFVRLWDIGTARELARVDASGEIVHGLAFPASGRSLLWAGDDGVVRISDVDGESDERTIDVVSGDWVYSLAVSPAGDVLAIIDGGGGVSIVDAASGKPLRRFATLHARDAAFLAGDRLVCGSPDGTLSLIDVAGSSATRQWHAHDGGVRQVAVAPSGDRVVSAGADGVVRLWDVQGDTARERQALSGHAGGVTALAVGADGSLLAAGAADGTLRLWTPDGDAIDTFTAHPGGVRAVAISPAGDRVVTGGADRMIRIWQRGSPSAVAELEAHDGVIRSLAFSPDGRTLASLAADRAVRLWQTDTWKWAGEIAKGRGMNAHPVAAASADGHTIAIGNSGERRFRLFQFDRDRSPALEQEREFRTEIGVVWSAALSPDASSLVTIGGDAARVWNIASHSNVLTMRPQGVVSSVGYSPDGTRVVTGSWDQAARIWDTASGRVVRQLTGGHLGNVTQSAFLPDGVRVITAGDDGALRIWNADSGELEAPSLQESGAAVLGLAISQNGHLAATVSADNVLRIWDLPGRRLVDSWNAADIGAGVGPLFCCAIEPQGRQIAVGTSQNALLLVPGMAEPQHRLTGHTAAVLAVAFSPDGKRLITGSEDFTARIWDVESGKEMLSLGRHTGAVTSVSFSGDGQAVLTAGRDGLAIVWPADDIAPSVLITRDRFDYQQLGSVAVIDEGLELNAPTHTSPAGLTVRAELRSVAESQVRLGKLCLAAGENSAITVAGNDVAVVGDDGSAVPAARFEISDDGRRLDVALAPGADRATAHDILRRIAFRIDPDPSRDVPPGEPQFETVTFRVIDSGTADSAETPAPQSAELPAIEIQILLAADASAAARQNPRNLATLPTSAKD